MYNSSIWYGNTPFGISKPYQTKPITNNFVLNAFSNNQTSAPIIGGTGTSEQLLMSNDVTLRNYEETRHVINLNVNEADTLVKTSSYGNSQEPQPYSYDSVQPPNPPQIYLKGPFIFESSIWKPPPSYPPQQSPG